MSQEIAQKHGNIMVSTFRKIYGDDFAKDMGPTTKLSVAMETLDRDSKAKLERDAKAGKLDDRIRSEMGL